jgi:type II secretory pathway component PulF
MPQFSYKARKRNGEIVQGVLDVADRPTAITQIQKMGLLPVAIEMPKGMQKRKSRVKKRVLLHWFYRLPCVNILRSRRNQSCKILRHLLSNLLTYFNLV